MPRSDASSAAEYLAALPDERRNVVSRMREIILGNLPDGYTEAVRWGMLTYEVPLARYPNTYNKQPLAYVSLAAQKHYYALYVVSAYQSAEIAQRLKDGFRKAGKKLDMGKSCIRFRRIEDVPLEVVGEVVSATPVDEFIRQYERSRSDSR